MSTQPTDEEIRELWSQYNPLHGIQSFARAVLVNWGTPSGDAEDAARYRWLALRAHKSAAYERYGEGAYWSIGFHADDGRLGLDAAIDAARATSHVQKTAGNEHIAGDVSKSGLESNMSDAEPQWLLLTNELLKAIESGDHHGRFCIVSKGSSEPEIREYEWCQGRGPHGFNTHGIRLGADEVTHVMPYRAPKMPEEGK